MAFKAFGSEQISSNALPWIEEYIRDHRESLRTCIDVRNIKLTAKGMLIASDYWRAFIYRSSYDFKHCLEFIEAWSNTKQKAPVLQMLVVEYKPHIVLGADEDRKAYWGKQADMSFHQSYATLADNPECTSSNKLPLPSTSSVSKQEAKQDAHEASIDASVYEAQQTNASDLALEGSANGLNGAKRRKTPQRQ